MAEKIPNLVVTQRIEITPDLIKLRVAPTGWQLPVFTPGQYATLGQYDFINIFEAPNDDAIFKVASQLGGKGIQSSITLAAKTVDDFIAATKP